MQSPLFPRYLVPPRSKYSPQHHILKHSQLPFLPQYQRPSFTPIQNNKQNYYLRQQQMENPFYEFAPNIKIRKYLRIIKAKIHKLNDCNVHLLDRSLHVYSLPTTPTSKTEVCRPKTNGQTNNHKDGSSPDGLYFVASDNDQHFVHNVGTMSFSSSWTCGRAGHCPCGAFVPFQTAASSR